MRIIKIKPNDVVNGKGMMVSVWCQGCPHRCKGCHNKETWDFNGGRVFTKQDAEEILKLLDANGLKRNLAILGGEPLCTQNIDGVLELCDFIKSHRKHTKIYVWTGYLYEHLIKMYGEQIFDKMDVLIDGKFEEDKKDLKLDLRGSWNQRIIHLK